MTVHRVLICALACILLVHGQTPVVASEWSECVQPRSVDLAATAAACTTVIGHLTAGAGRPQALATAYEVRAGAYAELGRFSEALDDFGRALDLDPANPRLLGSRAAAYLLSGDVKSSIADSTRAIELKPIDAKLFLTRGLGFFALGQRDRALEDYDRAIALDPDLAETWYYRGRLFGEAGDWGKAERDLTMALSLGYPHAPLVRGAVFELQGKLDRALEDYSLAISRMPSDAESHLVRGRLWMRMGHVEDAIADFRRSLALRPDDEAAGEALRNALKQKESGQP